MKIDEYRSKGTRRKTKTENNMKGEQGSGKVKVNGEEGWKWKNK